MRRLLFVLVTAIAALASGCGGAASEVPEPTIPEGWITYSGDGYAAAHRPDWILTSLRADDPDFASERRQVDLDRKMIEIIEETVAALPPGAEFDFLFLRVVDDFATNINTFPCDNSRKWSRRQWRVANLRGSREVLKLEVDEMGEVAIAGHTYDLFQTSAIPGVFGMQVLPVTPSGCGFAFTLSYPAGDPSAINEFVQFLGTVSFSDSR
jgi:hypothetical protein